MDSIMTMKRLIRAWESASEPLNMSAESPGIMPITWLMGPIERIIWNCSYMSRKLNCPCSSFFMRSLFWSSLSSCTFSIKPVMSPQPSKRETNDLTTNGSRSWMCSPVPMKMMGLSVAATALRAPPPFAWPSIFVRMVAPTPTACLKALA
eukprot:Lithocolla_globosa_v1_NODE_7694_length_913_cov_4.515152.p2 type:complete len:150 gc:universal NODE_7694_length_913_cov_4.515152:248-697(+)